MQQKLIFVSIVHFIVRLVIVVDPFYRMSSLQCPTPSALRIVTPATTTGLIAQVRFGLRERMKHLVLGVAQIHRQMFRGIVPGQKNAIANLTGGQHRHVFVRRRGMKIVVVVVVVGFSLHRLVSNSETVDAKVQAAILCCYYVLPGTGMAR